MKRQASGVSAANLNLCNACGVKWQADVVSFYAVDIGMALRLHACMDCDRPHLSCSSSRADNTEPAASLRGG